MTDNSDLQWLGDRARRALHVLQASSGEQRDAAIAAIGRQLRNSSKQILTANEDDIDAAKAAGLSAAMIDRLLLDEGRVEAMAAALDAIAALPDPIGRQLDVRQRPNGLRIERISVPLGVVGIIYESRPNVTADAAAICLKAANSVVLRGGSESAHSSNAIVAVVRSALAEAGLPEDAVQMLPSQERALVGQMLAGLGGNLDVLVPRGGRGLVERVQRDARVPVIGHLEGLCHVFVHANADPAMARRIVHNAKMRRTGICGAAETLLIDQAFDASDATEIMNTLVEAGCELRGCEQAMPLHDAMSLASDDDWSREYLDSIIAVRIVDGVDGALAHIQRYGSGHTESIITDNQSAADAFLARQDSAIVMHNASTQFADGGEFGWAQKSAYRPVAFMRGARSVPMS